MFSFGQRDQRAVQINSSLKTLLLIFLFTYLRTHTRSVIITTLKSHKYVCITTYQSDTKSNPKLNPTTKQHAVVNIQLKIVACPTYPDKFIYETC